MRATDAARLAVLSVLATSSLVVAAGPAQAATSTAPTRVGNDGVKTLTVTGGAAYFDTADEAVVLRANPANGHADVPGTVTGTGTCTGLTVTYVSNASCTGPLVFTADTTNLPSGTYEVRETRTDVTPFPTATTATTVDGLITVFAQPKFATTSPVAPATRGQSSSSTITVKGTGFVTGMSVDFGAGTRPTSPVVVASPTTLTVDVQVAAGALPGTRDVVLTSPDDGSTPGTKATATLPAGFTVTDAPTVASISPASGQTGTTQAVTVTGTHFVSGPDFVLSISGVGVANVVVTSATTITANVTPNTGAPAGPRSVFVTNPDGGTGFLTGGFTIIAPPNPPTAVKAYGGEGGVFLIWTAPVDPGSGPVTGYRVTTSGGAVPAVEVTGASAVITGLTNGTPYTFTVAAKNAEAGYGVESAAVEATPKYAVTLTNKATAALRIAGQSTALSGRLTRTTGALAISGATLSIRYAPQVGPAVTHTVVTGADGSWADTARTFTYTTAVTATYAGSATLAAKAAVATVLVQTKVTVTSPKPGATTSTKTPLSVLGATSPNKAGRTVYLFRVGAGGHLQALTKATVNSKGLYVLRANLGRGAFTLRVGVVAAAGNTAGYSSPFIARRA